MDDGWRQTEENKNGEKEGGGEEKHIVPDMGRVKIETADGMELETIQRTGIQMIAF